MAKRHGVVPYEFIRFDPGAGCPLSPRFMCQVGDASNWARRRFRAWSCSGSKPEEARQTWQTTHDTATRLCQLLLTGYSISYFHLLEFRDSISAYILKNTWEKQGKTQISWCILRIMKAWNAIDLCGPQDSCASKSCRFDSVKIHDICTEMTWDVSVMSHGHPKVFLSIFVWHFGQDFQQADAIRSQLQDASVFTSHPMEGRALYTPRTARTLELNSWTRRNFGNARAQSRAVFYSAKHWMTSPEMTGSNQVMFRSKQRVQISALA